MRAAVLLFPNESETFVARAPTVSKIRARDILLHCAVWLFNQVVMNIGALEGSRAAYRLVGGVLIQQTVAEVLPKVQANQENLTVTIQTLRNALGQKNAQAAAWKEKYGIRTQQEAEVEQRMRQTEQMATSPASTGVLA